MNSNISPSKLAVAALLGGVVLAGCNAVEDVRSTPATDPPAQTVVLEGKVYGLGIRRSVGLTNGASNKLVQGVLGEPSGARGRESRFSFGALSDGSSYNITLTPGLVPYGKICQVNNGAGTLRYNAADALKGAPQNIEVVCTDDPAVARYDIRVATPAAFRTAEGAKVTLTTEEGVFEADPKSQADGDDNYVWFRKALVTLPAAGVLPFQNIIKAYTTTGSSGTLKLVNRCAVTNHTFPSPAGAGADVTNVGVGDCTFTVGGFDNVSNGAVKYSLPLGVTTAPAMGTGGIVLELRYPNGKAVPTSTGTPTRVSISAFNTNFEFPTEVTSGAECPAIKEGETPIPCEVRGFYEVAIVQQPAGQRCLMATTTVGQLGPLLSGNPSVGVANTFTANNNWSGAANLYLLDESVATGNFPFSPGDFTNLRVYCRNKPVDSARTLAGTYQVTNQTVYAGANVSAVTPWSPIYTARRVYSHVLTFFEDGTFLFGAHTAGDAVNTTGVANHAEQGFYDYALGTTADSTTGGVNAVAGNKLRFTVHIDGSVSATTNELAGGLSSLEGPSYVGATLTGTTGCTPTAPSATTSLTANATAVRHFVMADVVRGSVGSQKTLKGRFGKDATPTPRCTVTAQREIEFVEPRSTNGTMEGTWISEDHLRSWTFNSDTTVGYHTGVTGFPNVQDTCFKMDDYSQSVGLYVPSTGGAAASCAPVGNLFNSNQSSLAFSPSPANQFRLPGWQGWMPGSELTGGRSPSPVHFVIAPAANFRNTANTTFFPPASIPVLDPITPWCTTEILGVRGTQNGELVSTRQPIYFCRTRAN